MNTLQKFTSAALLAGLALGSTAAARADAPGFGVAVPNIGAITAEVGKAIAADLTAHLRNALKAPRVSRVRRSPSVTVHEIETVEVVATRLPPEQPLHEGTARTAQVQPQVRL